MQEVSSKNSKQQTLWGIDRNTKTLLNTIYQLESCLSIEGYYNPEQETAKRKQLTEIQQTNPEAWQLYIHHFEKKRKPFPPPDDAKDVTELSQNNSARTGNSADPNERCIYIFARGLKRGHQCSRLATEGNFCFRCSRKPHKHKNNVLNQTPIPDKPETIIKDDTTELKPTGESLRNLCQRLSSKDILEEARNRCNEMCNQDISYDLLGAAKYIAQFEHMEPVDGLEHGIVIMDKHMVASHHKARPVPLYTIQSWKSLSSYRIAKTSRVTDLEGLITILWQLTCRGWPKDYYQWLGMDGIRHETPEENATKHIEYIQKIKEKTGLK